MSPLILPKVSISYREWIAATFNAPRSAAEAGSYTGSAAETAIHCTSFFKSPYPALADLDRNQICYGLSLIPEISGYGGLLSTPKLEFGKRVQLLESQEFLFDQVFRYD